jgi:hypothetical protein
MQVMKLNILKNRARDLWNTKPQHWTDVPPTETVDNLIRGDPRHELNA